MRDAANDYALALAAGWDDEGTGFVEPWQPKVGQRVRVLARPECFYCRGAEDEVGLVGIVESVGYRTHRLPSERTEPGERAHRFWVAFPDEIPSSGTHHSHFAAAELEPAEGRGE